ncbi:MAG: hypothetical protein E7K72_25520, partial [Roseomonas mucosa]|nr:hypothetical protein [Roseomonas mucosa]
ATLLGDMYRAGQGDTGAQDRLKGRWNRMMPGQAGSEDVPSLFLDRMEMAESGGDGDAANPRSSARGWHQWTNGTWLATARRYGGSRVAGLSEEQILALRRDRTFSRQMAAAYTANELDPALRSHGVALSTLSRYAAWHFGPGAGPRVMNAADDTQMSDILAPDAMAANPYLSGKTAGWWRNQYAPRALHFPTGDGATAASPTPATPGPGAGAQEWFNHRRAVVEHNFSPVDVTIRDQRGNVIGTGQSAVQTNPGQPVPWGAR